jgi:hypothetical protein
MVHKSLKRHIDNYIHWGESIIRVRLKLSHGYLTVTGIYTPVEGKNDKNDSFY